MKTTVIKITLVTGNELLEDILVEDLESYITDSLSEGGVAVESLEIELQ